MGYCSVVFVKVSKSGILSQKGQLHHPCGTISLFTDNELCDPLFRAVFAINFVPINEDDNIGILLDSSRLSQVGKLRQLVWSFFHPAVELG